MANVVGTPGSDTLIGTDDADFMDGGAGDDSLSALGGGDTLYGGSGSDSLDADGGDDFLYGGDGDDFMDAGDGQNLLDGGAGNDTMFGGTGNDTYVLGAGYGQDIVSDSGGADRVLLAAGVAPTDVSVTRDGNDLLVMLRGTGDSLRLSSWFLADPASRVETIEFNGGTVKFDAAAIQAALANQTPTAVADAASITEDATNPVLGNVLTNDTDPDGAAGRFVKDTGEHQLSYGKLTINGDGTYSYTLDSSLAAVQGLKTGETLEETFAYTMSDGGLNALESSATLKIVIQGADEQGQTIIGTNRSDRLVGTAGNDTIDGRGGSDTMIGGQGDDTYYVDAAPGHHDHGHHDHGHHDHHHRHHHHGHHHQSGDRVVEQANGGHDTVYSSVSYTLPTNVEDLHLTGNRNLDGTGNSAANWIEGNRGNNRLAGGSGDDLLQGGGGNDRLRGGSGVDILQGGDGNDDLKDKCGSTVFDGGRGNDRMTGGRSADFFAGGTGSDRLDLGGGRDVIAFNKGDGVDRIEGECQNGVLSLGGGIRYEDLRLRKDGKDLVLETGSSDRLVLEDWYKGKQSVGTLQVFAGAMAGFDPGSGDCLHDNAVELFDFRKLVAAFDDARSCRQNMAGWKLMGELLDAHLSGSDDSALGGDLAYRYGMTGTLAGMTWGAAHDTVAAAGFGTDKQQLQPVAQLPGDSIKLGS